MAVDGTIANQSDFLGDTGQQGANTLNNPLAGDRLTAEQMADARARKKAWLENQGLDENGNPLPAYGTSAANGGTATGFQVIHQPTIGTGHMSQDTAQQLGPSGAPLVGGQTRDTVTQIDPTTGAIASPAAAATAASNTQVVDTKPGIDLSSGTAPGLQPGGVDATGTGMGGMIMGQTSDATTALRDDLARRQQANQDRTQAAIGDMASPLDASWKTQQGANQARTALGAAPTVDMGVANGGLSTYDQAYARSNQVLDTLMNGSTTDRIGGQTLRNQLALARSAAGGAGAAQQALSQAQAAAPELLAQAAQSGTQEKLQSAQAAGNISSANQANALTARGQNVDIAKSNQAAGLRVLDNVAQLTGQQLQLDQANQELVGRMFTDMSRQNFDWSSLDAAQQQQELERWIKVYGIDQNVAAQLKVAASAKGDKGILDSVIPIVGGLAQLGAAVL